MIDAVLRTAATPAPILTTAVETPLGPITLRGRDVDGTFTLTGLWMAAHRHAPLIADRGTWTWDAGPFTVMVEQLRQWFAGERTAFDFPLAADGTPFQRRVWAVLATIPYAATWSYRDVAIALGAPAAVRAVGAANGRNPISIVVPCHRVVGADGSMTGYGGGIESKRWLLRHERLTAGAVLF